MSLQSDLQDLQNPNVRAYLDAIAAAEGVNTSGPNGGYDMMFGNKPMSSMADHPRQYFAFRQTDGVKNSTSAAGKYQFLERTWNGLAKQLGLNDFSPQNQDRAALALIRNAGVLDAVKNGEFEKATPKLGKIWASLPSSTYAQPKRSDQQFTAMLAGERSRVPDAMMAGPQPTPTSDPYLMSILERELMAAGPAPTAPTPDFFAQVAPQQAAPTPTDVSFSGDVFGPTPMKIMRDAASIMWDQTHIPVSSYAQSG